MTDLAARICAGDVRSVARAISLIERNDSSVVGLLSELYPYSGKAYRVGITGPPGAGKSTLTGRLAACFRRAGNSVGVLAVDITSPFTGGALLGDRIRMQALTADPGVFIRSMGNGGQAGGLCRAAQDAVRVMEAMGKEVVLVETAGAGQTEVDVVHQVDAVVLVLVPESGDEIQVLKAGVLEIADVIALNKSDRPGADTLVRELGEMDGWETPLVRTVATEGRGVEDVFEKLEAYRVHLNTGGRLARLRGVQAKREVKERLREVVLARLDARWDAGEMEAAVAEVCGGGKDPYRVAMEVARGYV